MRSMAAVALREESNSRAALAARSRPSGSKPVKEALDDFGGLAGDMTEESDSSFFFFPAPPNIVVACVS